MRTQDQKRAQHAYQKVQEVTSWNSKDQSKFKTLALKFPAMVLQCGILQTLAFYQKEQNIYTILSDWLCAQPELANIPGDGDIMDRLCHENMTLSRYRLVSRIALAYGTWLKRATEVILKDVKGEN